MTDLVEPALGREDGDVVVEAGARPAGHLGRWQVKRSGSSVKGRGRDREIAGEKKKKMHQISPTQAC